MPTSAYEIPPFGSGFDQLHGWLMEARSEGDAWLATQKAANTWETAIKLMDGGDGASALADMSNVQYPKSKRIARELVATLASFRHEGEFKVLWDNTLYDQAHLLTQLDRDWYKKTRANAAHRETLQYGVIKGTGYWYEEFDKNYWGPGRGDIRLTAIAPEDVTFVQLPKNRDIQRAYMVLIRFQYPLNLAKRLFATTNKGFADSLVPDGESNGSLIQRGLSAVQQFLSPALRAAGRTRQDRNGSYPTVDVYYAYTMDGAINQGYEPIEMGAHGSNWTYTVPYVGAPMPTEIINPRTNMPYTRDAKPEDCMLFPLRRLTIFSSTGVAYDGSSPWWHGEVPLARAWFNDLPWDALGGSLITDTATMETGIEALMRGMEDSAAARLDPPALYDENKVSSTWAKAFNPRAAGTRAAADLGQGNPIQFPVEPHYYDVPSWIPQFIADQEGRMDYLTGVRDMVAIAKAKQVPGADTLEKLMEMAGPIVQDLVRAIEEPLTQLGNWRKAYYFQFYTQSRVIETVGPEDGAVDFMSTEYLSDKLRGLMYRAKESVEGEQPMLEMRPSFQFQPDMLVPPGGPGETAGQRKDRIKRLITDFNYEVTESGLNEIHRMTTKLFYLQLMKEGFPISWWTFAKIARIPNFGPPPQGTNTEMERWVAQQRMKMEFQIELQQTLGEAQMGPGAVNGEGGTGNPPGRPQTYRKAPRMQSKDHGTRSTVTTA